MVAVEVGEAVMGWYVGLQEEVVSWVAAGREGEVRVAGLVAGRSVEARQGEGRSEVGTEAAVMVVGCGAARREEGTLGAG